MYMVPGSSFCESMIPNSKKHPIIPAGADKIKKEIKEKRPALMRGRPQKGAFVSAGFY
jgi:hypothetical protein